MSSIRVPELTVGDDSLKRLDEFMFSLGFEYYPGHDNKSEPSNMPWSTRWYRPKTVMYTTGEKGHLFMTVDVAQWLYDNVEVKV